MTKDEFCISLAFPLIIAFLIATWFVPVTQTLWQYADQAFFLNINSSLSNSPFWTHFWAIMNSRIGDWLSELCILTLLISATIRLKTRYSIVFKIILCVALSQILINKGIFLKLLHIQRLSPSLTLPLPVNLADAFPYLSNKVESTSSFPGDHASMLFLFTALIWKVYSYRYGLVCAALSFFFTLPRLISGAHWLSDAIIGSICITLFTYTLIFASPIHRHIFSDKFK